MATQILYKRKFLTTEEFVTEIFFHSTNVSFTLDECRLFYGTFFVDKPLNNLKLTVQ